MAIPSPPKLGPPGAAGAFGGPPREPVVLKPGQAPRGRMTVEGRVISVKRTESERWGSQYGMVVRLRNGVVVWSSVPRRLEESLGWDPVETLRGKRVRFTATFEPSERDPRFAFAQRPRDAELT